MDNASRAQAEVPLNSNQIWSRTNIGIYMCNMKVTCTHVPEII